MMNRHPDDWEATEAFFSVTQIARSFSGVETEAREMLPNNDPGQKKGRVNWMQQSGVIAVFLGFSRRIESFASFLCARRDGKMPT